LQLLEINGKIIFTGMVLKMEIIKGGITAPSGYKAAGIASGMKSNGKKDLALIYSDLPATAVAVFSTNLFKAAPLLLSAKRIKNNDIRAIIINSGIANACTGEHGLKNAGTITDLLAEKLDIDVNQVHISSTGVIGKQLPMDLYKKGIEQIIPLLKKDGNLEAAEAILTTDTTIKEIACQFKLPVTGNIVKIGGMAKGSGMIHPHMATMLAFITSDLNMEKSLMEKALKKAVDLTFNRISVDGDQSTNDSVFFLANGQAKNKRIVEEGEDYEQVFKALKEICAYLARAIVMDGEGATRFITIRVKGAKNIQEADQIARQIANSNLVKTACFGGDPNWGRIVAAIGSCNLSCSPQEVSVILNGKILFKEGVAVNNITEDNKLINDREINIDVIMGQGSGSVEFWTSDLSYDYVKINAQYHT